VLIATVRTSDEGRRTKDESRLIADERRRTKDKSQPAFPSTKPMTIRAQDQPSSFVRRLSSFLGELRDGLHYIANRRDVALYTFTKALWSLGGGILLLLTLFGKQVVPLGQDGAISIGLLYAARGVGTALGPIIAQRVFGSSVQVMQRWLGPAFLLTTAGYLLLSISPSLPLAMLAIAIGHTGGSIQWVYSTALLQLNVEDRLRGRVFAIEYAALMLATALSSYLTGIASDNGLAPRTLSVVLALIFVLPGIFLALQLWGRAQRALT